MSTFKIEYYSVKQEHITLYPDGTIEIYNPLQETFIIQHEQAKILKAMILAENKLESLTSRM